MSYPIKTVVPMPYKRGVLIVDTHCLYFHKCRLLRTSSHSSTILYDIRLHNFNTYLLYNYIFSDAYVADISVSLQLVHCDPFSTQQTSGPELEAKLLSSIFVRLPQTILLYV